MKTILHIIDTTGPGGAETVFIDLASQLPKDKYRSIVLIRGKGWVFEELQRRGFEPILMDAKGSFNWRYLRQLIKLIRKQKVDLIQSHLLGSNVYSSLAGLLSRTPVVVTFHGAVDVSEEERFSTIKFGAINMGASDIIAVSEDLRDNIANRTRLRTDKTRIIYNGIDIADFRRNKSRKLREQFGWSESEVIIGSLGNIRPAKAYDVLLQAASLLDDSARQYRFVIAGQGKGKLFDSLLTLRRELGLEGKVHFLGFCDDPADFLSAIDMFLLSSSTEGFSIATIQAMAAGLPVIATRSGGPQEIISHGEDGWLVEVGQAQEIADAVEKLMDDEALRASLVQAGQARVSEAFDIKVMVDAYQAIYDDALK